MLNWIIRHFSPCWGLPYNKLRHQPVIEFIDLPDTSESESRTVLKVSYKCNRCGDDLPKAYIRVWLDNLNEAMGQEVTNG